VPDSRTVEVAGGFQYHPMSIPYSLAFSFSRCSMPGSTLEFPQLSGNSNMTNIEERIETRINAAEIAISTHKDVVSRAIFTDDDPAQNLAQLLTSLQTYARHMGINFQAALEGDDENFWNEPEVQTASSPAI
jgi:hypothetical protein